jgi:hypothetical protein
MFLNNFYAGMAEWFGNVLNANVGPVALDSLGVITASNLV